MSVVFFKKILDLNDKKRKKKLLPPIIKQIIIEPPLYGLTLNVTKMNVYFQLMYKV